MRLALAAVLLALVAGCATHPMNASGLAPGTSREQVLARAGQPTAVVPLAGGGQRLQYSMQPFGHDVVMVDLDTTGKVVRARNVMTPSEFHRIEAGRWTRDDVLREFGRPAWVDAVHSWQGSVFTYRWKEGNEPMFYWVYFDPQGIVRRAHPGMEFINAPDEKR